MRTIIITGAIVVAVIIGMFARGRILWHKEAREVRPYLSYTRLIGVAKDCDEYWGKSNSWPSSLAQLRAFHTDLNEWAVDLWGRDFVLVPFDPSVGYGRIISYGSDGKPGGSTEMNLDIEVRFPAHANTNWNAAVGQALKKPYLRLQ